MKKSAIVISVSMIVLFLAALSFLTSTVRTFCDSFIVYAIVPEQIPLKLHTVDEDGNMILDSYTYTYHLTGITAAQQTQELTFEKSGETVIPLEPKTYVKLFMVLGHPVGEPKVVPLTKIPTPVLEQLQLEQLSHQQHLRWTTQID